MYNKVVDFIRGLYKTDDFIPLHAPVFIGNEKKYLSDCIDTTFVSSVGKYVDRFEEMVSEYTAVKKSVVCVNGTNALHLALKTVGVKRNTEVITQPLTFIATANAIAYCDASPIFIDVDKDTLGLSPEKLLLWLKNSVALKINPETNITEAINKSTNKVITACVPMHTFGHPCRIDEIIDICNLYHIPVIEDAAESLGSFYKGKHTGTFGKFGVLSFNGNKTITTGGGGMILTNDEALGEHIKYLTTQAKVPHQWDYVHDYIGYNYRMPNINAALGVAQMEQIKLFIENKRETANKYHMFFSGLGIEFAHEPENSRSNYWLNALILKNKKERDEFLNYTNNQGVMTRPVWRLLNELKMFHNCQNDGLENAKYLADRIVNIPSSVSLINSI